MADNSFENGRQFPHPLARSGKGYDQALLSRAQSILNLLMGLLPSNYAAQHPSTEYGTHMKAMATELARLTMYLEDLYTDRAFEDVRSEFLYQTLGYLVFLNGRLPSLDFSDEEFKNFLLTVIRIYFQGSTPASLAEGVALFLDVPFTIRENFLDARAPGSSYDISDQFGFRIEVELEGSFPDAIFAQQANIDLLLGLIRPAHTLYQLSFLFKEGGEEGGALTLEDDLRWDLQNYYYEDLRRYCEGMAPITSTTGVIDSTESLSVLRDGTSSVPLSSVALYAQLYVPEGDNAGVYVVTGHTGDGEGLLVHPRFKSSQDPVTYEVEVDRLGKKPEHLVLSEDASPQFRDFTRLSFGFLNEPVTALVNETLTLSTDGGTRGDVTFSWDLNGDGTYTETGESISYTAGAVPGVETVYVLAESADGQRARRALNITVS